jgi:thioredoxin reductase
MSTSGDHRGDERPDVDVAIVGGGPAGLSAALMLGRCLRRVILFDAGRPRNVRARGVHGLIGHEGLAPGTLLAQTREQLRAYETVEVRLGAPEGEVRDAWKRAGGFVVLAGDGSRIDCRKLLLATGMVDELPAIPGIVALWGRSVFPCPYCDAYEFRGQRLGVLGGGEGAATLARLLTTWSDDVTVFTGLPPWLQQQQQDWLGRKGVRFLAERVTGLQAEGDRLRRVLRADAPPVPCDALFLSGGQHQRSPLVSKLGCAIGPRGTVETGKCESTNVPGLFVAGDASDDAQLVVVAAAEGAEAAIEINRSLSREDFERETTVE